MANEDKKEELKIQQELLVVAEQNIALLEYSYGIDQDKQRLAKESIDQAKKLADFMYEETQFAAEGTSSLRSKSQLLAAQAKSKALEFKTAIEIKSQEKLGTKQSKERAQILKGVQAQNAKISENIHAQIENREELNKKLGIADNLLRGLSEIPFLGKFIETEAVLKEMETAMIQTGSEGKALAAAGKEIKTQLSGAFSTAATFAGFAIAKKALDFMVESAFKMDVLVTNIGNELGVSVKASMQIQEELAAAAKSTGLAYINAETMNKALLETSKLNKMNAEVFGKEYLANFITLTDRMGLGNKEAGKLSFLQRLQSKNVRGVLKDQVGIVNQYNKQNKLAFNAKNIIADVGSNSADVAVSLGMGVDELTKATLQATALGTTLDTIGGIADGLLNFEQSIGAELTLSLATNQRISLAKERELALNNKLGELAERLMQNEPILKAFREGNRIQQDLAAQAMNVSREQIAEMIMMEDKRLMTNEEFVEIYGEQTLEQLEALSAAEEMQKSIEKMKVDLATAFLPLVPAVKAMAKFTASVLESKVGLGLVLSIMGGMVGRAIAIAVAQAYSAALSPLNPANIASLGGAGLIAGTAIAGTIYGISQLASDSVVEEDVQDAMVSGIKINTLPMDSIEIDKGANKIAVGTNLQGQNMNEVKGVLQEMVELLRNPVGGEMVVEYDSFSKEAKDRKVKYKSNFA